MLLKHLRRNTRRTCSACAGFTLVELVIVILMIGVLAVFALPRLVDTNMWRLRAFGDDMQSQMQAMLRMSLAQRRPIVATVTGSGVDFVYASGAAIASLPCPGAATPCIAEGGTRSITFNSGNSGTSISSTGSALPITVSYGSYTQAFRIENESGLIYTLP